MLGHEVVVQARDGTRLALIHHLPCGDCERCAAGHESTCERFAAATIVNCLGADTQLHTRLFRDGEDLVLKGDGDPSLGSWRYFREHDFDGIADPDDVARDMLDNVAEGPTFPPEGCPFGALSRRQAVEMMSQGGAFLAE